MKRQILYTVLAAIIAFAASTSAEAGMFGRLSVLHGCHACGPAECAPCEPACCTPCEPACAPCEPICEPCEPCAVTSCHRGPFRPFGGFFMNLKNKLCSYRSCAPACEPCEPACIAPCEPACAPCEVAACAPCEPVCEAACAAPCEPVCYEPACGNACAPRFNYKRPFGGFFVRMIEAKKRFDAKLFGGCFGARACNSCGPCEAAYCEPACEPCGPVCGACDSVYGQPVVVQEQPCN